MHDEIKLSRLCFGQTRLTNRHLIARNNQHTEMRHLKLETDNQSLLPGLLSMEGQQKNYNIQSNIKDYWEEIVK